MSRAPLVGVLVFVLAGCGGSSEAPDSGALFCSRPSVSLVAQIEERLTVSGGGSLNNGWYVDAPSDLQDSEGWPRWLVGADVQGAGLEGEDDVAVWATGADAPPILAVDEAARTYSDWDAVVQPEKPAAATIDALRASSEYEDVFDCVAR